MRIPLRRIKRLLHIVLALLLTLFPVYIPMNISAAEIPAANARLDWKTVAASLSAGFMHSAMINYDSKLFVWGDNTYGQLGMNTDDYYDSPQALEFPYDVAAVSLGAYHSLVLLSDGTVWSFGRNAYGQLGTGGTENSNLPVMIAGMPQIKAIAAGFMHSLALGVDGSVWAWGNNTDKQVGDVPDEPIRDSSGNILGRRCLIPARIVASGAAAIAAGGQHSLYLSLKGQIFSWGDNSKGQLGDGTTQSHAKPAIVPGMEGVTTIVAGYQHSLAIIRQPEKDILMSWGDDSLGQLGLGSGLATDSFRTIPVRVDLTGDNDAQNDRIIHLAAGYAQTAAIVPAIDENGRNDSGRHRLLVWGSNSNGQLALGAASSQNKPMVVGSTLNGWSGDDYLPFEALALGGNHLLILSSTGHLGAAGRGDRGQLGNLSVLDRNRLVPVNVPDVILPAWVVSSQVSSEWSSDGHLVIRWPAAQDNNAVTGYRIRLTTPLGTIGTYESEEALSFIFREANPDSAYEITVMAYDDGSAALNGTQLSQLVGYALPQGADPNLTSDDFFSRISQSIYQIDADSSNWRPDPQNLIRPMRMPWSSAIQPVDESLIVRPASWQGFTWTAVAALILFILMLIDILVCKKKRSMIKPCRHKQAC